MNVSESLFARLSTDAGVLALVGTRIYPVSLPQTPTLPAITYMMTSEPTEHLMNETSSTIKRAMFRVMCWDTAWSSVNAMAEAVSASLDAFAGLLGGAGGARCWVTQVNQVDLADDLTSWKRRILDFELWQA